MNLKSCEPACLKEHIWKQYLGPAAWHCCSVSLCPTLGLMDYIAEPVRIRIVFAEVVELEGHTTRWAGSSFLILPSVNVFELWVDPHLRIFRITDHCL